MDLNGIQVAPFGPKLGQNDTPELRIIFQALQDPKTQFKNQKIPKIAPGGRRQGAKPLGFAASLRDRRRDGISFRNPCRWTSFALRAEQRPPPAEN